MISQRISTKIDMILRAVMIDCFSSLRLEILYLMCALIIKVLQLLMVLSDIQSLSLKPFHFTWLTHPFVMQSR